MEKMIKALQDFQTAYNAIVEAWDEINCNLSPDYPKKWGSFDELSINKWVNTSIETLKGKVKELDPQRDINDYPNAVECYENIPDIETYYMLECGRGDGPLYFVQHTDNSYYAIVYNEQYETQIMADMVDWLKIR